MPKWVFSFYEMDLWLENFGYFWNKDKEKKIVHGKCMSLSSSHSSSLFKRSLLSLATAIQAKAIEYFSLFINVINSISV